MAVTRLSDVIVPSVFSPYIVQRSTELSALFRSGIVLKDPQIDALAKGPSNQYQLPYFNDISGDSLVGSDDPAVTSTPQKIGAAKDVAQKHYRNQSWSSADLVSRLIGPDPMAVIGDLVADYWAREYQKILIKSLDGVIAAEPTLVTNVANDAVGAPAAAEKMSAELILTAKQQMGDAANKLAAIVMHSTVYTNLQKLNLISFIPNARGEVGFGTYLGYSVIVDDGCPAVAGVNRTTYTSYLFGQGAFAWGEGAPRVPVEIDRKPSGGNGEGIEELYTRRHFILHPRGIKWNAAAMVGSAPTNAELATATNWTRVYDRKNVRIVAIKTNG